MFFNDFRVDIEVGWMEGFLRISVLYIEVLLIVFRSSFILFVFFFF